MNYGQVKKWNVAFVAMLALFVWGIILSPPYWKEFTFKVNKHIVCDTLYIVKESKLKDFCGQKALDDGQYNNGDHYLVFPDPNGAGTVEVRVSDTDYYVYRTCRNCDRNQRPIDCVQVSEIISTGTVIIPR